VSRAVPADANAHRHQELDRHVTLDHVLMHSANSFNRSIGASYGRQKSTIFIP
jgi:hypothetical protein